MNNDLVSMISNHLLIISFGLSASIVVLVGLLGTVIQNLCRAYAKALRDGLVRIGYVRFHLLIGGLLTLLLLTWFGEAAELAFSDGSAQRVDLKFANALHRGATPTTVAFFGVITNLGGTIATLVLGLTVAFLLWRRPDRQEKILLIPWSIGLLGGALLNGTLKAIFQRPRPEFENPFLTEPYLSFPSGHAMGSVVLYGLLAYLVFLLAPSRYRVAVTAMALLLGTMIGLSRLVLGVHFLSDVLAGWVIGAFWVTWIVVCTQVARFSHNGSAGEPSESSREFVRRRKPLPWRTGRRGSS